MASGFGITPPNEQIKGTAGNRLYHSSSPSRSASPADPPNKDPGGDRRRNGTQSLAGQSSPVKPPNHQFKPGRTPMTPSVKEPGKGAVPVRALKARRQRPH